jgi:HPt (histidine-containing phosphotransfer) domain-containing protein
LTHRISEEVFMLSELPVIDVGAPEKLRASLKDEKFMRLLNQFLGDIERRAQHVELLRRRREIDEIGQEAHKTIQGASVFGAKQVLALAEHLQTACRAGDAASAVSLADRFPPALTAAQAALRELYGAREGTR